MAGAYAPETISDAGRQRHSGGTNSYAEGISSVPPWPPWNSGDNSQSRLSDHTRLRSPAPEGDRSAVSERGRQHSPMRTSDAWGEHSRLQSPSMPMGGGEPWEDRSRLRSPTQAASSLHWSRPDHLDRSKDSSLKAPVLPKEFGHAQRAFEHVQTELLLQSRRQDEMFERVARVEADLGRVARLAVENESLHATERQQKHAAMANLTRRTEDACLTCESLRKGQEHIIQRIERLEAVAEDREYVAQETSSLHREVDVLQSTVRDKLDTFGHALRRLDAMEQIFDENTKLRQEVAQLRRANERRDLEMAAVQGQIDALTKLVREQLRDPLSPPVLKDASDASRLSSTGQVTLG